MFYNKENIFRRKLKYFIFIFNEKEFLKKIELKNNL
jgi:hypothetical protein